MTTGRIRTTHAGSLPRTPELLADNRRRLSGETAADDATFAERLGGDVVQVVTHQRDLGIDVPNDGEYGHEMDSAVDYGAWWGYVFQRLGGLEVGGARDTALWQMPARRSAPGQVVLSSFTDRRDWLRFAEAYADPESGVSLGHSTRQFPVCTGPVTYTGQAVVARDIENMKAAMAAAGVEEGFLNAVGPGSCARFANTYYATDEEFMFACADALREEYRAVIDAGLMLQIDDPCIAENWDQINPAPTVEEYRQFTMQRVEALNHALSGLPTERIRFHLCWGSWHGPHTTDIPMADIVEVMLAINAGTYLFEAANVRHEHEWRVWNDVKLPDGKAIAPGVVSHATNLVEHPELVADRISRFAEIVGPERVLAGTDCGLGGRVHPQIAWAKLESLVQGAEIASRRFARG